MTTLPNIPDEGFAEGGYTGGGGKYQPAGIVHPAPEPIPLGGDTGMNIPDAAVEAAMKVVQGRRESRWTAEEIARAALEAAAPHLMAQAYATPPDCNKTVRMDEIHCEQEQTPPRCSSEIIQVDARSFFASCEPCGDGVTATTRREAKSWVSDHERRSAGAGE
jgi:hypothetical protein